MQRHQRVLRLELVQGLADNPEELLGPPLVLGEVLALSVSFLLHLEVELRFRRLDRALDLSVLVGVWLLEPSRGALDVGRQEEVRRPVLEDAGVAPPRFQGVGPD